MYISQYVMPKMSQYVKLDNIGLDRPEIMTNSLNVMQWTAKNIVPFHKTYSVDPVWTRNLKLRNKIKPLFQLLSVPSHSFDSSPNFILTTNVCNKVTVAHYLMKYGVAFRCGRIYGFVVQFIRDEKLRFVLLLLNKIRMKLQNEAVTNHTFNFEIRFRKAVMGSP